MKWESTARHSLSAHPLRCSIFGSRGATLCGTPQPGAGPIRNASDDGASSLRVSGIFNDFKREDLVMKSTLLSATTVLALAGGFVVLMANAAPARVGDAFQGAAIG